MQLFQLSNMNMHHRGAVRARGTGRTFLPFYPNKTNLNIQQKYPHAYNHLQINYYFTIRIRRTDQDLSIHYLFFNQSIKQDKNWKLYLNPCFQYTKTWMLYQHAVFGYEKKEWFLGNSIHMSPDAFGIIFLILQVLVRNFKEIKSSFVSQTCMFKKHWSFRGLRTWDLMLK